MLVATDDLLVQLGVVVLPAINVTRGLFGCHALAQHEHARAAPGASQRTNCLEKSSDSILASEGLFSSFSACFFWAERDPKVVQWVGARSELRASESESQADARREL